MLRILRHKFGELPAHVVMAVTVADAQMLERVEARLPFANSLDEVFAR